MLRQLHAPPPLRRHQVRVHGGVPRRGQELLAVKLVGQHLPGWLSAFTASIVSTTVMPKSVQKSRKKASSVPHLPSTFSSCCRIWLCLSTLLNLRKYLLKGSGC